MPNQKSQKNSAVGGLLMIALAVLTALSVLFCCYQLFLGAGSVESKLVLYDGPKSLKDASVLDRESTEETNRDFSLMHCTDTTIKVNGYDCYVYDTNVNNSHKWAGNYLPKIARTPIAYFDFQGRATIEVTVPDIEIETATISPVTSNIKPKIDKANHTVTFTISEPGSYTIQFNDKVNRAVHIFANPYDENRPTKSSDDLVYVGPGEWDIENISLESGQSLYISGGAVIHGVVRGNNVEDVKVYGPGIIDGSKEAGWKGKTAMVPIDFRDSKNVTVDGPMFLNSNAWVFNSYQTDNLHINNIKVISCRPNGDGITLQSCTNSLVENSFVRSWDDSLVLKNYGDSTDNMTFRNMTLWTDLAQCMEIGYETNKGNQEVATISNVTFENIYVINALHKPVISVHNADDATISNVLFKNITVENAKMGSGDASKAGGGSEDNNQLIDFNITENSNWSTTAERGQIRDVTIDGVKVLGGDFCPSRIQGYDAEHTVENVTIRNLEILGQKITSFEQGKFQIDEASTKNLTIE